MAPELFEKKNQYDPLKVDIWAFGILFYYLFEGTYPFKGYNEKDLIKNISLGNIHFKKMNPPLQALIRSLLTVNPLNRPTASDILHQLTQ
jgi:serine/threonine protein kinase